MSLLDKSIRDVWIDTKYFLKAFKVDNHMLKVISDHYNPMPKVGGKPKLYNAGGIIIPFSRHTGILFLREKKIK